MVGSLFESVPRGNEFRRRAADFLGDGEKVGLVRFEKAQHSGKQGGFAGSLAQVGGIQPGHVEQASGAAFVGQSGAKRL